MQYKRGCHGAAASTAGTPQLRSTPGFAKLEGRGVPAELRAARALVVNAPPQDVLRDHDAIGGAANDSWDRVASTAQAAALLQSSGGGASSAMCDDDDLELDDEL